MYIQNIPFGRIKCIWDPGPVVDPGPAGTRARGGPGPGGDPGPAGTRARGPGNGSIGPGSAFYTICRHKCFQSSYMDPIQVKCHVWNYIYVFWETC